MSAGVVVGRSITGGYTDRVYYFNLPPSEPGGPWELWIGRSWSRSRDWVVGGTLETRLTEAWSLEVNGLYRQLHGQSGSFRLTPDWRPGQKPTAAGPSPPVVTWQFPLLARYRFQGRNVRPFVALGPAFRTAGNLSEEFPSRHGIAVGAGFETRWGTLKISPTLRYTLWAGGESPRYQSDQVEFLVGFSRASEEAWRPLGPRLSLGFTLGLNLVRDYPTSQVVVFHPGDPQSPFEALREPSTTVYRTSGGRSLLYGPMVELHMAPRWSLEVEALHRPIIRRTHYEATEGIRMSVLYSVRGRAGVIWHFPVLVKYRFPLRRRTWFLGAGPSFRLRQTYHPWVSPYGVSATVGIQIQTGPVKVLPALRYTHWAPQRADVLRRNQADILLSFRF